MNSFPARAYGIVRRPRTTFASIIAAPNWVSVLAATTVVTFLCSAGFFRTEVGRQALVDQWERAAFAFGQSVDDAQYARLQDTAARDGFDLAYAAVTAIASGPVMAFGASTLLYLTLNRALRQRVRFSQVLAVVCYAGVILTLRHVVATPIDYVRETVASPTTAVQFFSMLDEGSLMARFLGAVDLFVIWWILVLAVGMSALYHHPTSRLAAAFTGAYVTLALLAALVMAVSGGTI